MKPLTLLFTSYLLLSCNLSAKSNKQMGIFDKLFGKNNLSQKEETKIEKTSEMLDETIFWNIIDLSIKNTQNQEDQESFLINEIQKLTPKEMIGFRLRTDQLLFDTYTSELWCAAYIMNQGCSDDGFEYFRNWIISRGKEVYYNAKKDPDSLISEFMEGEDYYDFESFGYTALTAFENKTGKDLYDYIADDISTTEGNYSQLELNWNEEKPETMKVICPKLFEKMWP